MLKFIYATIALTSLAICIPQANADSIPQLQIFASPNDVLEVTLVAEPREVMIGGTPVTTNLFTVCSGRGLTEAQLSDCKANQPNPYGGAVFKLKPRGRFKVTLIDRTSEPLNTHTHGLYTPAWGKRPEDLLPGVPFSGSYGDFVFVSVAPTGAAPAGPGAMTHHPMNTSGNSLEYDIEIPSWHPRGMFWIHPHVHGMSAQQVSDGMAGLIEIGDIDEYVCIKPSPDGKSCQSGGAPSEDHNLVVRQIILKDMQLAMQNGTLQPQRKQDPSFCAGTAADITDHGYCDGAGGGRWVFTMNGVNKPRWEVPAGKSEIWRIQNASANITYSLCLTADGWPTTIQVPTPGEVCAHAMPFQVLSLDGVSFGDDAGAGTFTSPTRLQRHALLMPGSRIEILVAWRDPSTCASVETTDTCPASAPSSDKVVVLQNLSFKSGGDAWPRIRLAEVDFPKSATAGPGVVATRQLPDQSRRLLRAPFAIQRGPLGPPQLCRSGTFKALADGEKRRIYFGIVKDSGEEVFLLGHTIIDQNGEQRDEAGNLVKEPILRPFGSATSGGVDLADLCVPAEAVEQWQLVNLSAEVHNFHIHQNKFSVEPCTAGDACDDATGAAVHSIDPIDHVSLASVIVDAPKSPNIGFPLHDTIIVPRGAAIGCETPDVEQNGFIQHAEGYSASDRKYKYLDQKGCLVDVKNKDAPAGWINIKIPFDRSTSPGRYVFHCHILEHEDRGMMASIRVLRPDQQ
ncbi:multicopper oxidase domain-containing protein [Xanthobacter autotrophicus DSM 431]|uniref:multicopper oxidase domain-containing protein n=1 Tax=Xanthobacter nonsaccharivorans TaxID=3119912 RepID=UPI0037287204